MFPGAIQMVTRIISALIVSDPLIVRRVNMRRLGVPRSVVELAIVRRGLLGNALRRRMSGALWAMSRNMPAANFLTAAATLLATTLLATTLLPAALSLIAFPLRDCKYRNRQ
jgi:hypothetical protein